MAFVQNNQTVLTAIPVAPPYFFNLTRLVGFYALGDFKFTTGRQPTIIPPFQRWNTYPLITKFWIHELVQGTLIVIFIWLLSEVLYTVLLRTQQRKISSSGLYLSCLLDDFSRFRVLLMHVAARSRDKTTRPSRKRIDLFPFLALCASLTVFLVDVSMIQTTQPIRLFTSASEFNLQGIQPVAFGLNTSTNIRQRTAEVPCISPFNQGRRQQRHFKITACVIQSTREALSSEESVSDNITIGSWYHKGGNDHLISFGEGWHRITARAEITLEDRNRTVKRMLFKNDDDTMNITRYLHDLTMHWAMQWSCNKEFSRVDCFQLLRELEHVSSTPTTRMISLWSTAGREVLTNATGLVSTYRIRMNAPHTALSRGMGVLVASSALTEVKGPGRYVDEKAGTEEDGAQGLFSESARQITGFWLLLLTVCISAVLLLLLRFVLKPISISELAVSTLHDREPQRLERIFSHHVVQENSKPEHHLADQIEKFGTTFVLPKRGARGSFPLG